LCSARRSAAATASVTAAYRYNISYRRRHRSPSSPFHRLYTGKCFRTVFHVDARGQTNSGKLCKNSWMFFSKCADSTVSSLADINGHIQCVVLSTEPKMNVNVNEKLTENMHNSWLYFVFISKEADHIRRQKELKLLPCL